MLKLSTNAADISLSNGNPRLYKGKSLAGATLVEFQSEAFDIHIHEIILPLCSLTLLHIHAHKFTAITIDQTDERLRLEAMLGGHQLSTSLMGTDKSLQMGQYRLDEKTSTFMQIPGGAQVLELIIHISRDIIEQLPLPDIFKPTNNRILTFTMLDAIDKIMNNPYETLIRDAYYDASVRDLLFHHISIPAAKLPGELTNAEFEAVLKADRIIAEDLTKHYTIEELARLAFTNTHVLKVGFAKLFGMGTFERLRKRKMDQAKLLVETTDQQIQEIALTAGYSSITGFIHAFRKEFGTSPRKWRKERRAP